MQVLARFGMLLADWQPLQQPQSPVVLADFAAWRPLLESDAQRDNIFQVQLTWLDLCRLFPFSGANFSCCVMCPRCMLQYPISMIWKSLPPLPALHST